MTTLTTTCVWVVYSKAMFYGYSESLGNGKETKEICGIFSTQELANKYIIANEATYLRRDELLNIEKMVLDTAKETPRCIIGT